MKIKHENKFKLEIEDMIDHRRYGHNLQSNQVKRTPQDYINEYII